MELVFFRKSLSWRLASNSGHLLALGAGLLVLLLLWAGPLPGLSRIAFSPHMILHLLIIVVAAPLIAFGLSRYLPPMLLFRDAISWSLLATFSEMVIVWGWHIPVLHEAAARHDWVFVLQQSSFAMAGLAVWTVAFNAGSRAASAAGAFAMFLTFMHMSMFGLMLALSSRLLYAPELCQGAFGFGSLEDQQFGGVLMAVFGGVPYLLATGMACFNAISATGPVQPST